MQRVSVGIRQIMNGVRVRKHTSPPEGLPGIDGDAELFLVNGGVSMRRPNLSAIPRPGGDVTLLSGTLLG